MPCGRGVRRTISTRHVPARSERLCAVSRVNWPRWLIENWSRRKAEGSSGGSSSRSLNNGARSKPPSMPGGHRPRACCAALMRQRTDDSDSRGRQQDIATYAESLALHRDQSGVIMATRTAQQKFRMNTARLLRFAAWTIFANRFRMWVEIELRGWRLFKIVWAALHCSRAVGRMQARLWIAGTKTMRSTSDARPSTNER